MKSIIKMACIMAFLSVSILSCTDTEKQELVAELNHAKIEFKQLDSLMAQNTGVLHARKDSLVKLAENSPALKAKHPNF